MDSPAAPQRFPLAHVFTLAIAAWILTGALFKLVWGTPADLPPVLFKLPLAKAEIYKLAIAAEFVIVTLAVLKPRFGWILCAAAMLVFDLILATQMASGAESCGCFGSKISMPPWGMSLIDTALLAGLLWGYPWSRLRWRGVAWPLAGICAIALASLPYLLDRSVELPPRATPPAASQPALAQGSPATATATAPATTAQPGTSTPPKGLRGYVDLDTKGWTGKRIEETPLASLLDVYQFDQSCTWVLWRWTCDHCAEHLKELAAGYDQTKPLVLIRLKDPADNAENRLVNVLPQGPFVMQTELSDAVDYLATTPIVLELKDGLIVSAVENPGH